MRLFVPLLSALLVLAACSGDEPEQAPAGDATAAGETTGEATGAESAEAEDAPASEAPGAEATPATPKYLSAAHVLVQWSGSQRATPAITRTKEEALARAEEVIAKLDGGADFATLAKEYSDGPSGPKGGDLGSFPPGQMIPEFTAAVLKAEVGAVIAEPVETSFGWHVIKRQEARLYRASHILIQHTGSMRAGKDITRTKEEAKALADEVLAKAAAGGDFAALAKEHSNGPSAPRGGDLGVFPSGVMHPEFEKGVESAEPNTLVPNAVETPFGFHLIYRFE